MFQKQKPFRSDKYLAFIRGLDCCNCGKPPEVAGIEAHHINGQGFDRGKGIKIDDCLTLPLCRICHNEIHANKNAVDQQFFALKMIAKAFRDGVIKVA